MINRGRRHFVAKERLRLTSWEVFLAYMSLISREDIESRVGAEIVHIRSRQAMDGLPPDLCTFRSRSSFSRSLKTCKSVCATPSCRSRLERAALKSPSRCRSFSPPSRPFRGPYRIGVSREGDEISAGVASGGPYNLRIHLSSLPHGLPWSSLYISPCGLR